MKNIFKLRRMEDGLLLISLIITTFLMFNISILLGRLAEEDKYTDLYPYTVRMEYNINNSGDSDERAAKLDEMVNYLSGLSDGNVELEIMVFVNGHNEQRWANIILAQNEDVPFLQNVTRYADRGLYIGETLYDDRAYEHDGEKIISLSDIPFEVAGVLKNHWSGGVDRSIFLFWDECDEEQKTILRIDSWCPKIVLNSQRDLSDVCRGVSEKLDQMGIGNSVTAAAYPELENRWYRFYNSTYQGIAAVFCCLTCWAAALFWVSGIYKDIVVRRTFGYDMKQVALYLGGELLKLEGIAFVGAFLMEWIFLFIMGDFFIGMEWIKICLFVFGMQNILTLAQLCMMLKRVKKLSIAELLREE